jgi:hypothetical protein
MREVSLDVAELSTNVKGSTPQTYQGLLPLISLVWLAGSA